MGREKPGDSTPIIMNGEGRGCPWARIRTIYTHLQLKRRLRKERNVQAEIQYHMYLILHVLRIPNFP
jgi:hypothetical protein